MQNNRPICAHKSPYEMVARFFWRWRRAELFGEIFLRVSTRRKRALGAPSELS
jgi:hypothetical protein